MPSFNRSAKLFGVCAIGALSIGFVPGCATEPNTEAKKESQHESVASVVKNMQAEDPSLKGFLDRSAGYVVFPSVGKGGLVVGGSFGRGEVFENGAMVGYADISQATVGLQAGGQTFTEIIAFENTEALEKFKGNKLAFAANASAVLIKSGAGATARYQNGVAVFTKPIGGAMFEASVGGQQFRYLPK